MTAPSSALLHSLIAETSDYIALLRQQLAGVDGVLLSHGWVAGFDNGLYVDLDTDERGTVTKVRACGIAFASRLTKADAERLTANGNLKNGAGESARALPVVQALGYEVRRLVAHLEMLTARLDALDTDTTN